MFSSSTNAYTVTWVNWDGTVLETDYDVPYGETPVYNGITPTRAADAQYTYTFNTWTPAVDEVTGDITYKATYTETVNKYTVTWLVDGIETTEEYEYGVTPVYPGSTPTREGYTFAGWTPEISSVSGEATYTATWTANEYTYNIVYKSSSGKQLGTASVTGKFDSSTTVSPKEFAGYTTPESQTVEFDSTSAKDITFTYELITYNISYTLDSGEVSGNPTSYNVESDAITLNNPTRTGYTFIGWTGSNGNTPSESVTIEQGSIGDMAFTANWQANTYTIVFNANGGTGTMPNLSMTYDESKNLTVNAFTREYYYFTGWNTKADGKGTAYNEEQLVKNLIAEAGGTVTLYAQWEGYTIEVIYHPNGATKVEVTVANGEVLDMTNSSVTDLNNKFKEVGGEFLSATVFHPDTYRAFGLLNYNNPSYLNLKREGYSVNKDREWLIGDENGNISEKELGQNTGYDGKSLAEEFGVADKYKTENVVVHLYCNWVINYWVVYNPNGGSLLSGDDYHAGYDNNLIPFPYHSNTGTDHGITYTINDDKSITANGTAQSVTAEEGDNGDSFFHIWGNQSYDQPLLFPAGTYYISGAPTTGKDVWFCSNDTYYKDTGEGKVFNLEESKETSFKLRVEAGVTVDNVVFSPSLQKISEHRYGVEAALHANAFVRDGYTFIGWSTSPDGAVEYKDKESVKNLTKENGAEIILYAVWEPNEYTVKFDANGGSGSMSDLSMTYDEFVQLPNNVFTKEYYIFAGWNTEADGSGISYTNEQSVKNLTVEENGTATLYAQWTPITYTIVFDANDGSGKTYSQTMAYDIEDQFTSVAFERDYYTFTKWNTKANGSGTSYTNEQSVKNLTTTAGEVITLYAQWTGNIINVIYHPNGATKVKLYGADVTGEAPEALFENYKPGDLLYNASRIGPETNLPNGLTNPTASGYLNLTRTGYHITRNWIIGYADGTMTDIKISENNHPITSGIEFAKTCGVTEQYKKGDVVIYAYCEWEANEYKIIYNPNGGSLLDGSISITDDNLIPITYTTKTIGNGKVTFTVDKDGYITISGDTTDVGVIFYHVWGNDNSLLFKEGTYELFGGYESPNNLIYFCDNATNAVDITGDGVIFDADKIDSDKNNTNGINISFKIRIAAEHNESINATFKPVIKKVSQHVYDGKDKELHVNQFVRDGYTFAGWATTPDGAVVYEDNVEINLVTTDGAEVVLYAVWEASTSTASLDENYSMTYVQSNVLPTNGFSETEYTLAGLSSLTTTNSGTVSYKRNSKKQYKIR